MIGLERTVRFFFQRHKIKGSLAFFGGIIIILSGWSFIGMIIEAYGFFVLFGYVLIETFHKLISNVKRLIIPRWLT